MFCTLQAFICLSWTSHWSIKHAIKIHTRETFVILWSVNCHLSVIKMFLTVKWFWKLIEKLKLKVLLFSSLPHATCPGFAGKRTKKIWWASTWLGCRAPRKGLWNFHRKTSPRSFWGWTYTIMWKSECKFKDFYPLREKYCALTLTFLCQWWVLCQLLFLKQLNVSCLFMIVSLLSPFLLSPYSDSLTSAVTDVTTDDFQIYISVPDLNWHTISLQIQCECQYRITLQ